MEDKELPVEGQAPVAPETVEAPATEDATTPPAETPDKEMTEWASNKGYAPEDLQDEKLQKAIKMAYNAEKMAGRQSAPAQQAEPDSDAELDALLNELIGVNPTPEATQRLTETVEDLDPKTLSPEEQKLLAYLDKRAEARARAIVAPYEADLRRKQIKGDYDKLSKEYGPEFLKNSPAILAKMRDVPGISMEDATIAVLNRELIKRSVNAGITQGKEMKSQEIKQQVEQSKKADTTLGLNEYAKLSLDEQAAILKTLQNKG